MDVDSSQELGRGEPVARPPISRIAWSVIVRNPTSIVPVGRSTLPHDVVGYECSYEATRLKPGMKPGAIESIYKRLDILERALFKDKLQAETQNSSDSPTRGALSPQADEGLTEKSTRRPLVSSCGQQTQPINEDENYSQFRHGQDPGTKTSSNDHADDDNPPIPGANTIDAIAALYFSHIHPWIPMINQDRFRQRLRDQAEFQKLLIVVHAMSIAVSSYLPSGDSVLSTTPLSWSVHRLRKWILTAGMDSLSLENLQGLIILVFNDIGNGNASRAWSIVASLSRTVEYCQLTREQHNGNRLSISRPFSQLSPADDWADEEERRRIFWNVFLLDRFCSISTGWSVSLTSTDVCQRLPSDGLLWRKKEATLTPYLGVWDKSTGQMGFSPYVRTPLDATHSTPAEQDLPNRPGDADIMARLSEVDMSRVGQFAYCVEATESMSRVTNYFLQQTINPHNPKEIDWWLTRFKELDLRLAQWKMLLPHIWKSVTPNQSTRMDPNLTVAHITHNASTILLHQPIAYPPLSWPFRTRLPSAWSAATCCHAGVEISTITQQYLTNSPSTLPLSSQFAFCVYIAGRMMLVHWRYDAKNKLPSDFWFLIKSLEEMANRWLGGSLVSATGSQVLPTQYAMELRRLWERCSQDESYELDVNAYTQEINCRSAPAPQALPHPAEIGGEICVPDESSSYENTGTLPRWASRTTPGMNDVSLLLNKPQLGTEYRRPEDSSILQTTTTEQYFHNNSGNAMQGQSSLNELDSVVPAGFDDYLMHLDRVIAFEDGSLFTTSLENGAW
ncbi:hypothetical protein G7046_g554 [Stylonectria norvegica]|nr:hypothetical protein G7046_g554 [Stylonectria norvegica]